MSQFLRKMVPTRGDDISKASGLSSSSVQAGNNQVESGKVERSGSSEGATSTRVVHKR